MTTQCKYKEVQNSWSKEYQVLATGRLETQAAYEAQRDLEELEGAIKQQDAMDVSLEMIVLIILDAKYCNLFDTPELNVHGIIKLLPI